MNKSQRGFTMVELVFVILILGVLAAFAVPRFTSLLGEARAAATNGAGGAVRSASALVHATSIAQQTEESASGDTVVVEGGTVALAYGYPTAAAGINAAIDSAALEDLYFSSVNTGNVTAPAAETTTYFVYSQDGTLIIDNCYVEYAEPTAVGGAPTINIDVSGC